MFPKSVSGDPAPRLLTLSTSTLSSSISSQGCSSSRFPQSPGQTLRSLLTSLAPQTCPSCPFTLPCSLLCVPIALAQDWSSLPSLPASSFRHSSPSYVRPKADPAPLLLRTLPGLPNAPWPSVIARLHSQPPIPPTLTLTPSLPSQADTHPASPPAAAAPPPPVP